jgi:hypothetical protein
MKPDVEGSRPGKTYRGSARRLRRIALRGNWSLEIWLLVAWILFLLFVVVPWVMNQSK